MTPRAMRPNEEPFVRDIYAVCHPSQPVRPDGWFTAYPTLVVEERGMVVGFTSFSVSPNPGGATMLYGQDLCVLPAWRNRGLAWQLTEAQLALARAVGATVKLSLTEPSNVGMIRLFERQGLHACQLIPDSFGPGQDGVAWAGRL